MVKSEIHMHSTFSDGEYSPAGLVDIARKNGVSILSLTDHDTFAGIREFLQAAGESEVECFPGIEITTSYRDFNLHLLGYFKSAKSILPDLKERVESMTEARQKRMHELIDRINEVIPKEFRGTILFENVRKAAEGVLARPHLAREMVRLGIVPRTQVAFDKYLVEYNIEKKNLDIDEAIGLVRKSGGVPVLAHPGERSYSLCNPEKGRGYDQVHGMMEELKSYGLLGLECIYPYHERTGKVDYFKKLAREYELIITGSRDFHGFINYQTADIFGTTRMDDDFLEKFKEVWG